jgi:phosphate/phosphite/phosphonate ABC transporter binding protein
MTDAAKGERVTFGIVDPKAEVGASIDALLLWISKRAGVTIERQATASYEALHDAMRGAKIDVAWLPPIVHLRLERSESVVPIVTSVRSGLSSYQCLLVVRAQSDLKELEDLRGSRVAWVDPWSAAGYVLPRGQLSARGIDLKGFFADEHFYGSHTAALRAVAHDKADVAGTFGAPPAALEHRVEASRDSMSMAPPARDGLRTLAAFGAIPADIVGARPSLNARSTHARLRRLMP